MPGYKYKCMYCSKEFEVKCKRAHTPIYCSSDCAIRSRRKKEKEDLTVRMAYGLPTKYDHKD